MYLRDILHIIYPALPKPALNVLLGFLTYKGPAPGKLALQPTTYSQAALEQARALFSLYDKDGSGSISVHEIEGMLTDTILQSETFAGGSKAVKAAKSAMIQDVCKGLTNDAGELDWNGFLSLFGPAMD